MFTFGRHRHIISLVFLYCEAQTHQFGLDGLRRSGFRVQADGFFCHEKVTNGDHIIQIVNEFIVVCHCFNAVVAGVFGAFFTVVRKFFKERKLLIIVFLLVFSFFNDAVCERLKLQFVVEFQQFFLVGLFGAQFVEVELYRHVGLDGCQKL